MQNKNITGHSEAINSYVSFDAKNITVEKIPLPLAGILLSDPIHKAVLISHQIDAGAVLFEHTPNEFYLSSSLGFSKTNAELESHFVQFCLQISQASQINGNGASPPRLSTQDFSSINQLIQEEGFTKIHIFEIHDYLNLSGYWIIFFKNDYFPSLARTPLSHSLDSPHFIDALKKTIIHETQSVSIKEIIASWVKVLDARDKETEAHTRRVADMAVTLAKDYGLKGKELDHIHWGGLLHDIGKVLIPNEILHKPGYLNDEEKKTMQLHPTIAKYLLSDFDIPKNALEIPLYHHERWSGSGYPNGLAGEEIPLSARIFSIVDVWDALNNDRPYRAKLPKAQAKQFILENAGVDFDPNIVTFFFK